MIHPSLMAFHDPPNTQTHTHMHMHYPEDSHLYYDDTMDRRHSVSESLTPFQSSRDGHYSTSPSWRDIVYSWKLGAQMDPSVSLVKEINQIIVFKYHSVLTYDELLNS